MKKKSIKFYILIALGVVFLLYNIVWGINYLQYIPLQNAVGYNVTRGNYSVKKDGLIYATFAPDYLSFDGNLSISMPKYAKQGEVVKSVDMIIWPVFGGDYEVGISIVSTSEDEENTKDNVYATVSRSVKIELDEHMNPKTEEDKYLLEENQDMMDEIKAMYQRAYDMWGILGQ